MTPEIQDLISLRNLILFGGAVLMALLVSVARVARERGRQGREDLPLTTFGEGAGDVIYGTLAALALLLFQDTLYALPIKAGLAMAMLYGSMGPTVWDLLAALVQGKYRLTKKEDPS